MEITCAAQLLELCESEGKSIPQVVAEYEAFRSMTNPAAVRERMGEILQVMREAVQGGIADQGNMPIWSKATAKRFSKPKPRASSWAGPFSMM